MQLATAPGPVVSTVAGMDYEPTKWLADIETGVFTEELPNE